MKEIQAKTRSVRELLSDTKYGIDYYQLYLAPARGSLVVG